MKRRSFRSLLAADGPLILPGAHDALAARLIQRAGFGGYFIGGFGVVGARFGVPDIGLKSLGDISQAVRDIVAVCDLPVLVDADDGYGDVKNVVHTVQTYERMGVGALFLEDQRWPKRCGHLEGKVVVPVEEHAAKIRAAASERIDPDTFLIARTDARAVTGLDDAMRRAERYLRAGADCIFIEALRSVEELERVGKSFDLQVANPLAGGVSPILRPEEYYRLGFKILPYGIDLILRVTRAMQVALEDMRSGKFELMGSGATLRDYLSVVGFDDWTRIEGEHRAAPQPSGRGEA
ncbi:MAG: isocitrate lyase/PEP mutase family protein [Betaproteobacteria bacterium]|nr:isocitrate lyase/PEP mutase family protein [Betaproteobacteria bacterium]